MAGIDTTVRSIDEALERLNDIDRLYRLYGGCVSAESLMEAIRDLIADVEAGIGEEQ